MIRRPHATSPFRHSALLCVSGRGGGLSVMDGCANDDKYPHGAAPKRVHERSCLVPVPCACSVTAGENQVLNQVLNQVRLSRSLTLWLPVEAANSSPRRAIGVKRFLELPRKLGAAGTEITRGDMGVSTAWGSVTASTVEEPLPYAAEGTANLRGRACAHIYIGREASTFDDSVDT
jgi:hypothetical protein